MSALACGAQVPGRTGDRRTILPHGYRICFQLEGIGGLLRPFTRDDGGGVITAASDNHSTDLGSCSQE
jgi:hypothetical protein